MERVDPLDEAALAAARAFCDAALAGDEDRAQAACTEPGWADGDDPVRGLFRGITKKGLVFDLMGPPRRFAGRAAQLGVLSHPKAPRPLGDLWLLLEDAGGTWRIVGASKNREVVGLFLWGKVPGTLSWRTLPQSGRADTWAGPVTAALQSGEAPSIDGGLFETRLETSELTITPLASKGVEAAGRAAAGWQFTTPTDSIGYDVWVVLDTSVSPPEPLRSVEFLGLEPLLQGLDLDWPHEDPDQPGRALTPEERPQDPAGAAAILGDLLRKSMAKDGIDPEGDSPESAQARELLGFLGRMVPKGAAVPEPGSAARQVVLPPALQAALGQSMQKLVDEGVAGPGELRVDKDFVEQHGGALVGGLFAAMMGDALPPAIELTVPVKNPDPGGPQVVKLTAEPRTLLRQLVTGEE